MNRPLARRVPTGTMNRETMLVGAGIPSARGGDIAGPCPGGCLALRGRSSSSLYATIMARRLIYIKQGLPPVCTVGPAHLESYETIGYGVYAHRVAGGHR